MIDLYYNFMPWCNPPNLLIELPELAGTYAVRRVRGH
jgi:hypothetical protein